MLSNPLYSCVPIAFLLIFPVISRSVTRGRSEDRMDLPPFQRLLEEHRVAVYRFLVAAVGPQEADDCFQETFLAAMRAYPRGGARD